MATHSHNDQEHGHGDEHGHGHVHLGHVLPIKVLVGVFGGLLCLTVITVLAAQVDFGSKSLNLAIALLIATVKASMVVLYFMHIRYDRLFHAIMIASGLLAAGLFVAFTLVDRSQYEDSVMWDDNKPPAMAPRPR
ncbi:MAG TPA: cytochrome C oxidase subunit IV family protein [Haliangium sp.]|nr:cytochrome C oxidase subunit IV family protein [Haliangium sp.]